MDKRYLVIASAALLIALAACGGSSVPAAPSEVSVTPVAGGLRVDWVSESPGVTGFNVYRELVASADPVKPGELESSDFVLIAKEPGDARSHYDFTAELGSSYRYQVAAFGAGGESEPTPQTDPEPVSPLPGVDLAIALAGAGVVTASGGGETFVCSADCVTAFAQGTAVTLEAEGVDGQHFATWLEDCTGAGACTLTLAEPSEVVAAFSSNVLRLVLDGDAPVTVAVSPAHGGQGSSQCDLAPWNDCGFGYPAPVGVSVNVTLAEGGSQFVGFGDVCESPQGRYCIVNSPGGLTVLTIQAVRPPVANADSYPAFLEDTQLSVGQDAGVLANDVDSEWDTLRAQLVAAPSSGQLDFRSDGSFDYVPDPDFNGTDEFTYRARDEFGNESDAVKVSLSITAVNDRPGFEIASDPPEYRDGPHPTVTIPGFASAISPGGGPDEASQTLTFSLERTDSSGLEFQQQPSLSPTGTLTYRHQPGTWGTARYRVLLKDNGGTANGGEDTSEPRFFEITANPLLLTVAVTGSGSGTVTPAEGTHARGYGTVATTNAIAGPGSALTAWGGACSEVSSASANCNVTIVEDTYVEVTFTAVRRLEVSLQGSGRGNVTGSPVGVGCAAPPLHSVPRECAGASVLDGTTVTLNVTTYFGADFVRWEGACSGTASSCQVVVDSDEHAIAVFIDD